MDAGRSPTDAHPHLFVDEWMWQQREIFLRQAFVEARLPEEMQAKWIRIDEAFKNAIVKHSVTDCTKRYATDTIIAPPDPAMRKAR